MAQEQENIKKQSMSEEQPLPENQNGNTLPMESIEFIAFSSPGKSAEQKKENLVQIIKNLFRKKSLEEKFIRDYLKLVKKYGLTFIPYFRYFKDNKEVKDIEKMKEIAVIINDFLNKNKLGLRADIMLSKLDQNDPAFLKQILLVFERLSDIMLSKLDQNNQATTSKK